MWENQDLHPVWKIQTNTTPDGPLMTDPRRAQVLDISWSNLHLLPAFLSPPFPPILHISLSLSLSLSLSHTHTHTHTHTHIRKQQKTEADTGVLLSQAKEYLEPPEAGRGRKNPALEPSEGDGSADTLISDFWP